LLRWHISSRFPKTWSSLLAVSSALALLAGGHRACAEPPAAVPPEALRIMLPDGVAPASSAEKNSSSIDATVDSDPGGALLLKLRTGEDRSLLRFRIHDDPPPSRSMAGTTAKTRRASSEPQPPISTPQVQREPRPGVTLSQKSQTMSPSWALRTPESFQLDRATSDDVILATHATPEPELRRNPEVLRSPDEPASPEPPPAVPIDDDGPLLTYPRLPPLGLSGPSGVLPGVEQESSHFVPMEDRWRMGFPEWDRYDKGHPRLDDYPYVEGSKWDSYNQNVLKGDYPIIGQHTFLTITATNQSLIETRQVPTPATSFESTTNPNQQEFFGNPNQFFYLNNLILSVDLLHGDASFKPADWRLRLTPIFNLNYLSVNELGIVSPNVEDGTTRYQDSFSLQEWFFESKIADLSPDYDFVSMRAGSQLFNSDFRGFVFNDTNRGLRLFGTRLANRDQFNAIYFDQLEKDTNSGLNTFDDRHQNTLVLNYFHQDFIWPGYTAQLSFHYNHDKGSTKLDRDGFLVRPDPAGVAQPHSVNAYYLGWSGDGHINRFNITHAFYQVLGRDTLNPLAGQPLSINAQMAALELSYDRDWVRFRSSLFYTSGDHNIDDTQARGFDTILDNPNFAGGQFSYWQRQAIKLLGVNLKQRMSLVPDLRSSKTQGQSNFVNPGLELVNVGMDFEVTPKSRLVSNANFLWFDDTSVLEQFTFQEKIRRNIGIDLSLGMEYRPFLNNRTIITAGVSGLLPGQGFKDLYDSSVGHVGPLFASFVDVNLSY
jgi:hypothetical protein